MWRRIPMMTTIVAVAAIRAAAEPADWPAWESIPDGRFGIAHGGLAVQGRVPMHDFYLMEQAGISWTRATPEQILTWWGATDLGNLPWTPWARLDHFLAEAEQHGVQVLMLLSEPMRHTKSEDGRVSATYIPPEGEAFERHIRFVRELAARCKGKVHVWEFFNEMNLHHYRQGTPSVDEYLAWLKPTYAAIKEIDPNAQLTTGGFGYRPIPYLREMMEKGAGAYFDILNVHYYPNTPEDMFLEWVEETARYPARTRPQQAGVDHGDRVDHDRRRHQRSRPRQLHEPGHGDVPGQRGGGHVSPSYGLFWARSDG